VSTRASLPRPRRAIRARPVPSSRTRDRAPRWRALAALLSLAIAAAAGGPAPLGAQGVPSPQSVLGFGVGADRSLADWPTIVRYFGALAAASPAVVLDTLGPTTNGQPFILATISTPANIRRLAEIRAAQAKLADPRTLGAEEERRLIAAQPSVILISCNIHSTEIASSQMAMELAWRLATDSTLQAQLERVVVLLVPSMNPDGEQMVTEWYRSGLGTPFEGGPMPWIYHPYVGHDNNRDWYMVTQKETRLVTDLLYRRWFPEVFYDVHQMGSEGARLFVPPFVDPINPNVDPLIVRGIAQIGAEMSMALETNGKSGVADHVIYDLWWHGGARSTPTRHNMIGVLTEAASVKIATPITQTMADLKGHDRGLPKYQAQTNFPNPWPGGVWRLRDIVDYELIAARALVKLASDQREAYVRNFVFLGRKSVRLGETEKPYGYEIPLAQRDPSAARRLVEVLRVGGVEVDSTPRSYLVRLAQPYRAHAKDLIEVQHYPKLERWPGGPPERPYDVAGWTLPLQMGVTVWPVDTPLTAPRTPAAGVAAAGGAAPAASGTAGPPVRQRGRGGPVTLDPRNTADYRVAFQALASGARVDVVEGGAPASRGGPLTRLARAPRIALYRSWTGNIDEGWTRWLFDQFAVPYSSLSDSGVKAGKLRDRYDVIVVPDMSLREARDGMSASAVPARYAGGLGAAGLAELKAFAESGGTLVMFDHAAEIATSVLGVDVRRITVPPRLDDWIDSDFASGADSTHRQREPLYAPGSVLRVLVDTRQPVSRGMPDTAAVYFTNSVTFEVPAGSATRVIARYPARAEDILLSGYLQGGVAIAGKAAAVEAQVGGGRVILFGFRPQYRGQAYGTFRMVFNALLEGGSAAPRR
jgi:hypothetical protein